MTPTAKAIAEMDPMAPSPAELGVHDASPPEMSAEVRQLLHGTDGPPAVEPPAQAEPSADGEPASTAVRKSTADMLRLLARQRAHDHEVIRLLGQHVLALHAALLETNRRVNVVTGDLELDEAPLSYQPVEEARRALLELPPESDDDVAGMPEREQPAGRG